MPPWKARLSSDTLFELARAMDRAQLTEWLEGYDRAWRTPGTDPLADFFAKDATYSTAPYENPHRGLAAIGEGGGAG
jgi:hypothetical protein